MLLSFSEYSSFVLLYPKGAPRFLRSAMAQPISRLPLLLSATCGTAYDALMSPLCAGATQIWKGLKVLKVNGSRFQGPQ